MRLTKLTVDGVRNLADVTFEPGPGLNLFIGPNGAGKTSLLEALYCLGRGRSFRRGGRHEYLNRRSRRALIVAELDGPGGQHRLGLERSASNWRARLDGRDVDTLGELAHCLAVAVFHPDMHELIEGAPEERRRFLDFGVFHVEPSFYPLWQTYRRALRQRNAALRATRAPADVRAWDEILVDSGEKLTALRHRHVAAVADSFARMRERIVPELGVIDISLTTGWHGDGGLAGALAEHLDGDREQRFTRWGPHRADLRLSGSDGRIAGRLSRGQQKLVALGLLLAQTDALCTDSGVQPVIGLDDLPSELDAVHQDNVVSILLNLGSQLWVTGTEAPRIVHRPKHMRLFHVEQGRVSKEP